jgi:site-specific recombinase XerC
MRKKRRKPPSRKIVLRLPDLDHTKAAVLNSLSSPHSRRNYKFAMEQFITWYCSEPRLALNRAVVLRFRLYLESLGLAAGTVNQRLAAVRRLAYEAADSGLLSPELAAGIRRVKGVKQLGSRLGNWLSSDQAKLLLENAEGEDLRSIRDLAMMAVLLGCGLRRAELSALEVEDMEVRQGHWAIVDLIGKGRRVRTVPMPMWVKEAVDRWIIAAKVSQGRIFRAVSRHGTPRERESPRTSSGTSFGGVPSGRNLNTSLHMICAGPVRSSAIPRAEKSNRSSFSWDTRLSSLPSDTSAANRTLRSQ